MKNYVWEKLKNLIVISVYVRSSTLFQLFCVLYFYIIIAVNFVTEKPRLWVVAILFNLPFNCIIELWLAFMYIVLIQPFWLSWHNCIFNYLLENLQLSTKRCMLILWLHRSKRCHSWHTLSGSTKTWSTHTHRTWWVECWVCCGTVRKKLLISEKNCWLLQDTFWPQILETVSRFYRSHILLSFVV